MQPPRHGPLIFFGQETQMGFRKHNYKLLTIYKNVDKPGSLVQTPKQEKLGFGGWEEGAKKVDTP